MVLPDNIPQIVMDHGRALLMANGRPFRMLAGEIHNSSASSLEYMEQNVWPQLEDMNCNTAIAPISWELFEPQEGHFDYTLVDGLIAQARRRDMKLILLWFASWKNSWSTYAPFWVRRDLNRFVRIENMPGRRCGSLSPFCTETRNADAAAFSALLGHICDIESQNASEPAVLMVQIENEMGVLGGARDYSVLAQQAFESTVPEKLMRYLVDHESVLHEELRSSWHASGRKTQGTWAQIFMRRTDEFFMAWHYAQFVEHIACAGKKEYPLPFYVNAWLASSAGYPQGGPVAHVSDIWRAAAPSIITCAPDIYAKNLGFAQACREYDRPGNPLFIPEICHDTRASSQILFATGEHHPLCVSPFGIETAGGTGIHSGDPVELGNPIDPTSDLLLPNCPAAKALIARTNGILAQMYPQLVEFLVPGCSRGFLEGDPNTAEIHFGDYIFRLRYPGMKTRSDHESPSSEIVPVPGGGMILQISEHDFWIVGLSCVVECASAMSGVYVDAAVHDEGEFVDGKWRPGRRLNGDEGMLRFGPWPEVRRISLLAWRETV